MRLIDADLLEKEIYKWMPKDQETWMDSEIPPIENLVVSIMMTIQEQPIIDAIPVEFIQKEIERLEESLDFYGSIGEYDALRIDAMYQHDALTGLLRHWKAERKDNGTVD